MIAPFRRFWLVPALVISGVTLIDQLTKAWLISRVAGIPGSSLPVLGDWLKLTYVQNTGVAFGMFQNIPNLFVLTSIVISVGALYFYRYHLPNQHRLVQVCIGAIVGGAVGNIIDRVRLGYVIDFIHVTWFPGIFNFADSCISCGVVALAVFLALRGEDAAPRTAPTDALSGDGQS